MRSFHRYMSDAMVLFMFLHLAREYANDRFRAARAFSWITGVPVIIFVYASGITGYWLVWDQLAQYVAIETAQWIDWFPIFGDAVARNFLRPDSIDDRFFSLLIFMHIFVPLFLLGLLWLHIQRITKPDINPPKSLCYGFMAMGLVLSLLAPATSHGPANLSITPMNLNLDWFYLGAYPLFDILPAGIIWTIALLGTIILVGIPYLPRPGSTDKAEVNLQNCNGCAWCDEDCPYSAITMVPRTDGKPFDRQASISDNLCVGCGICVGSCPSGSPYRKGDRLTSGVELKEHPLKGLRQEIDTTLAASNTEQKILAIRCAHAVVQTVPVELAIASVEVPCIGMVPPSFVDYAISRGGASGVIFVGCPPGRCHHRKGAEWTKERIARKRDPHLRKRVTTVQAVVIEPRIGNNNALEKAAIEIQAKVREVDT